MATATIAITSEILSDREQRNALMDRHEDYPEMLFGKNENGEDVTLSVNEYNITVQTFQSNHWIRENVVYRDGSTDELFNGRW